jgi:nucleoid-associated protein YgaU
MNRYQNIETLKRDTVERGNIRFRKTTVYPQISPSLNDIYVITTASDRYDVLAQKYYKDTSLWWIIAMANNDTVKDSLYPPVGVQLRIPTDISNILTRFNELNELR